MIGSAAAAQTAAAPEAVAPEYRQSWADYLEMKAKAAPPKIPNWSGLWRRRVGGGGLASFGDQDPPLPGLRGYGQSTAQLTPKYKAAYDKKVADIRKDIEWGRLSYCLPAGMPRWLGEPFLKEFIVTPEKTWMINEEFSEVRRIHTDGQGHLSEGLIGPLWQGDSIGFWDGDTLVIHTTHLKAGEYQKGQPDFSFKASLLERVRMTDPETIVDEITAYDPESLLKPYKATFTYRKVNDPALRLNFSSCEEGNNAVRTPEGGTNYLLPGDPGYRDPNSFGIPDVALDSLPK
jgi:hypothetical protein